MPRATAAGGGAASVAHWGNSGAEHRGSARGRRSGRRSAETGHSGPGAGGPGGALPGRPRPRQRSPPLPLPPAPADPLLARLWAAAAALTAADPDRSRPAGVWPAARGAPAGAALAPAAPASAAAPPPPALGAWPAPAAARAAAAPPLPPAARPAAAPAALVGDRAVRVLAVDDNEVNRIVLAGLLGELRCVVQLASDGEDALRCYGEDPPDLVIMDLHMPRLDGLTAAARIRALERARGWGRALPSSLGGITSGGRS